MAYNASLADVYHGNYFHFLSCKTAQPNMTKLDRQELIFEKKKSRLMHIKLYLQWEGSSTGYEEKFEDTTGVIRICSWRENRQHIYQTFEDTTGVIRICNWRENRQHIYQTFEDTTGVIRICSWSGNRLHLPKVWRHHRGN
jgi:hypothetical protein